MATARSLWGQLFLSSTAQVEQEEKIPQYTFRSGRLDPGQRRQTGRA
jgi:hypothetical protein